MHYGRLYNFHRVCWGRNPGTLKSDIVSKNTINSFGFETLKLKIRKLKLWKPTVGSQEVAIKMLDSAKEWIRQYGFTFDREATGQALVRARRRGVDVMIGIDCKFSLNGRTREQLGRLKEIAAHGVVVNLVSSFPLSAEHPAAGRLPCDGRSSLHAKVAHTEEGTMLGSTDWTTSSTCNVELGIEMCLDPEMPMALQQEMTDVILRGKTIYDAEVTQEGWNTVAAHMRGRGTM